MATKIVLVSPQGFHVKSYTCPTRPCDVGLGPLVDVVFDKDSTSVPLGIPVFDIPNFSIQDVKIWDVDGVQLNPAGQSEPTTDYFKLYIVQNLSTGA